MRHLLLTAIMGTTIRMILTMVTAIRMIKFCVYFVLESQELPTLTYSHCQHSRAGGGSLFFLPRLSFRRGLQCLKSCCEQLCKVLPYNYSLCGAGGFMSGWILCIPKKLCMYTYFLMMRLTLLWISCISKKKIFLSVTRHSPLVPFLPALCKTRESLWPQIHFLDYLIILHLYNHNIYAPHHDHLYT